MRTLNADEAKVLLDSGDYAYVDVRSEPEFAMGQVPGAYNIPYLHRTAGGMAPNPSFAKVFEKHFGKERKVVVGCAAGGRSLKACEELAARGFTCLVNMDGGFGGRRDPLGKLQAKGWVQLGYPVCQKPEPGRDYASLKAGV